MAKQNDEVNKSEQDQYNSAFGEQAAEPTHQSDDDAFGITPPAEAVAAAESSEAPGADADDGSTGETGAADAPEAGEQATQEPAAEAVDPMAEQRRKSAEGRLKKIESELAAKAPTTESAGVEALEDTGEQAEAEGNEALGDAAGKLADQVEDGNMSLDQAMKQLTEDFGEPFVKMIQAIAESKASEAGGKAVAGVQKEVQDIISHISNSAEQTHFEKIAEACPDFNDIRQSDAFKQYLQSDPALQTVASSGSAKDVIKLIKGFESSSESAKPDAADPSSTPGAAGMEDPEGPSAADAATGVRSGGMRIPDEPADSSDYEGAWNEASKSK